MSTLPDHLRVAFTMLGAALERLDVAREQHLPDSVHHALTAPHEAIRAAKSALGETLGALWAAGVLTPADMEPAQAYGPTHICMSNYPDTGAGEDEEPPRLSAECADEEPADLEDVEARVEDRLTDDELLASFAPDVEARAEAALPPAEVLPKLLRNSEVLPRCPGECCDGRCSEHAEALLPVGEPLAPSLCPRHHFRDCLTCNREASR